MEVLISYPTYQAYDFFLQGLFTRYWVFCYLRKQCIEILPKYFFFLIFRFFVFIYNFLMVFVVIFYLFLMLSIVFKSNIYVCFICLYECSQAGDLQCRIGCKCIRRRVLVAGARSIGSREQCTAAVKAAASYSVLYLVFTTQFTRYFICPTFANLNRII